MPHPDDFDFYSDGGRRVMDRSLGIQKMPDGYSLMLDSDGMFYFWCERATGRISEIHWNKWAVYRGAKRDAQRDASKIAA
jgi:alpha-tubulin suppressor-like RCC1 family protein